MVPFTRWLALIRLIFALIICSLCASCVADFTQTVREGRKELEQKLSQPDIDGHRSLKASWYGRLVLLFYEKDGQANLKLRKKLAPHEAGQLNLLMRELTIEVLRPDNFDWADHNIVSVLGLPKKRSTVEVEVLSDDIDHVYIVPDCAKNKIRFSIEAIRKISEKALAHREANELEKLADEFALSMFNMTVSESSLTYPGPAAAALFDKPPSKYLMRKIEREVGAQGTAVWKSLGFVVAHEAHHLWTGKCERTDDDLAQQKIEIQADVLGTLLSITAYNNLCGRKLPAKTEDVHLMIDKEYRRSPYPQEVQLQMALVPSPELLVGASGVAGMQQALGQLVQNDPSHPSSAVRLEIDARGTTSLASRLYQQPLKNSVTASLVRKFASLTKDELLEIVYGNLTFVPNYSLVNGFLICSKIEFQEDGDEPF